MQTAGPIRISVYLRLARFCFQELAMLVKQILNNNVVSAVDEDGLEVILTGRGLLNTHNGARINRDAIDKIFRLEDSHVSARFKDLVSEVPMDILQLTADIITHARGVLTHKLSDGLYVTLADHLHLRCNDKKTMKFYPIRWSGKSAIFTPQSMRLAARRSE
jgi:beta-glucoside operon transcriptional antiterminator